MDPIDYCRRIESGRDDASERVIMARIALNALVDAHAFPVDLSELAALSSEANILTRSMLSYCAMHPEEYGSLGCRRARQLAAFVADSMNIESSEDSIHEGKEQ